MSGLITNGLMTEAANIAIQLGQRRFSGPKGDKLETSPWTLFAVAFLYRTG
jgi:hypothetical protein